MEDYGGYNISTPFVTDSTTASPTGDIPSYLGFICAGISVIAYGSNFVPVKKFETGDGLFFQWVFCGGVFLSGLILQIVRLSTFYPLVMTGGVLWTTGNMCVVPIIKTVGMGLGMCIWGMFNLLSGWATGRFGLLGITPEVPGNTTMNYIGVALAVFSSLIYMAIKSDVSIPNMEIDVDANSVSYAMPARSVQSVDNPNAVEEALSRRSSVNGSISKSDYLKFSRTKSEPSNNFFETLSPPAKKGIGIGLAIVSGLLYGSMFTPAIYIQDNYHGASQNSLDYVFAHFCGIYLTSTAYFIIYCAIMHNKPRLYPKIILPSLLSGALWGLATGCWFVANKALSEPVSFPIITTGPGLIASLFWGIFIFKEVKGKVNIALLLVAFCITTTGCVLAGVSKG